MMEKVKKNLNIIWKVGGIIVVLTLMWSQIKANQGDIRELKKSDDKIKEHTRKIDVNEQRYEYIKSNIDRLRKQLNRIEKKIEDK